MIILGVDPGTLITGYGVIGFEKGRYSVIDYDVIMNSSREFMPVRLKKIYDKLIEVINKYHPDEFAIETAFYGKNAQSALKIGHARGVAILAAVNFQIPTTEYSPREVKKAVVGNGAANKNQVQFMVKSHLKLSSIPKYFDSTDALAVALCHSFRIIGGKSTSKHKFKSTSKKHRSWSDFVYSHPERIVSRKK